MTLNKACSWCLFIYLFTLIPVTSSTIIGKWPDGTLVNKVLVIFGELMKRQEEAENNTANLMKEIDDLRKELRNTNNSAILVGESDEVRRELQDVNSTIAGLMARIDELEHRQENMMNESMNLGGKTAKLEEESIALRGELNNAMGNITEMTKNVEHLKDRKPIPKVKYYAYSVQPSFHHQII